MWTEADGSQAMDTERLDQLLLPEYNFQLIKGPRGEALHLRGANRHAAYEQQQKQTVTIKYVDGIIDKEQVWTLEPDPECIVNDARSEPRFKPRLARHREDIDTPFKAWYNAAVSQGWLSKMEMYFNQRLDGQSHSTRKTSRGELVRFLLYDGRSGSTAWHPLPRVMETGEGTEGHF